MPPSPHADRSSPLATALRIRTSATLPPSAVAEGCGAGEAGLRALVRHPALTRTHGRQLHQRLAAHLLGQTHLTGVRHAVAADAMQDLGARGIACPRDVVEALLEAAAHGPAAARIDAVQALVVAGLPVGAAARAAFLPLVAQVAEELEGRVVERALRAPGTAPTAWIAYLDALPATAERGLLALLRLPRAVAHPAVRAAVLRHPAWGPDSARLLGPAAPPRVFNTIISALAGAAGATPSAAWAMGDLLASATPAQRRALDPLHWPAGLAGLRGVTHPGAQVVLARVPALRHPASGGREILNAWAIRNPAVLVETLRWMRKVEVMPRLTDLVIRHADLVLDAIEDPTHPARRHLDRPLYEALLAHRDGRVRERAIALAGQLWPDGRIPDRRTARRGRRYGW